MATQDSSAVEQQRALDAAIVRSVMEWLSSKPGTSSAQGACLEVAARLIERREGTVQVLERDGLVLPDGYR